MDKILHQNEKMLALLKGLLISYAITALLLLLMAFLMLKLDLPGMVISGGINMAYIVSGFAGGFLIGRKVEQKKFLWGLLMGVCYFVVLMLISVAMNSSSPLPIGSLLTVLMICGMSGMLGGMVS